MASSNSPALKHEFPAAAKAKTAAAVVPRVPVPPKRVQLLRSKSLPAPELERRLPLCRNDSNQSSQSTSTSGGAKDSGFASGGDIDGVCSGGGAGVGGGGRGGQQNGSAVVGRDGILLLRRGNPNAATIRQHYYPEGGWGWVVIACALFVHLIPQGLHMAYGALYLDILRKYGRDKRMDAAWLGALSQALSLLLSPVVVAICRRKSTRLTAVLGGLITSLGCLFTSFTSQFHQMFFSYGAVVGVGVGLVRDTSFLMVGQYFKRKRETVEIVVVGGSGLGIALTSLLMRESIRSVGWRLGLQAVTGVAFLAFFLGVCYRSASLYHPQRRAILHLKNQKRKIKDKAKISDKPPFFDFATLRSRTVQIVLVAAGVAALGVNTPIVFLVYEAEQEGLTDGPLLMLQVFLGAAFALGCAAFGLLVVKNSNECRIARQYLCQASAFMVAVSILAFTTVHGYHGYVVFAWIYGVFCGGYHYSLKMYTYEKVRARNFSRAWGFVQCAQAIPTAVGAPITGYINAGLGDKSGFFFSSGCVFVSSLVLFLIDVHKRRVAKTRSPERRRCSSASCSRAASTFRAHRASSLPDLEEAHANSTASSLHTRRFPSGASLADMKRAELTCISEEGLEGIADNLLDEDFEYLADCMTSCDQVEQYLMLSEYENNLCKTKELETFLERSRRRKSLGRMQSTQVHDDCNNTANGRSSQVPPSTAETRRSSLRDGPSLRTNAWRLLQNPSRSITVIDEITTTL